MKKETLSINVRFTEQVLGSLPANKEIFQDFIATKAPTQANAEEEAVCIKELTEKGTTIFAKDDIGLFLWDYQLKGFLKEGVFVLSELGEVGLTKWTYKRVVDSCIFVSPRRLYLLDDNGKNITETNLFCERPARMETMQGDRVALLRSESLPARTQFNATIEILVSDNTKSKFKAINLEVIESVLNYGALKGIGQWRNASNGRFSWHKQS